MELDELVKIRRSTRKYQEGVYVSNDEIKTIFKCVLEAPSWKNVEASRYYVCNSEEANDNIRRCLPEFNINNTKNVNCFIICGYKTSESGFNKDGSQTNELGDTWGAYDLGLQGQLLVLKAQELGYDSLIMGIRDSQMIKVLFNIPEDIIIMSVISLGKREGEPLILKRKEVEDIIKIY